jgi:hypothetical protein
LPPSKKTRALLAYLCLQPRRFSREHLCQLLWEVPDDPRGSLRWSLSKLRNLLDDKKRSRVLADRGSVGVDTEGVSIDMRELRLLVKGDLAKVPIAALEAAPHVTAATSSKAWVLELSTSSWGVAGDRSLRACSALDRTRQAPGRPGGHCRVRALVGLSPYEESHRATLIRLLNAARQFGEAEEQFQLGLRILKEAAIPSSGALVAARRAPRIDAPPKRELVAPLPEVPAAAPATQGLFGREAEMAGIADALNEVTGKSRCAMLLLAGAPGIGKTRVLEMALALARDSGAFVLQATAFESDAIRPFALWIDALRALDPAVHDQIFGDTDVANRDRLFARLSDLIARESAEHPVVLLFDDVQWCDESSAAALHYVARMNRGKPFLGLLAARDGELRDNAPVQQALRGLRRDGLLREIDLGPLPGDALVQLIDERAPGADSERLSVECGGNPLLAIELARAVIRGSVVGSLGDLIRERWHDWRGWSGRPSMGCRCRASTSATRQSVGLDAAEVGAALDIAQRHAMPRARSPGPRARTDRARCTTCFAQASEPPHRGTLEGHAGTRRAADLAHHATLSGDRIWRGPWSVPAGCAYDSSPTTTRCRHAKPAAGDTRRRARLRGNRPAEICSQLAGGRLGGRRPPFRGAAERALDHGACFASSAMASWVRWTQGQWTAAREQTLQAARAVRGGQDEAQIVGMAETAKCLALLERDMSRADAMLMEASALARRKGFSHHAIAAGLGMLRFHENRLDEADEFFCEARTLCKSAGDRVNEYQANEFLVMLDFQRGRLAQAGALGGTADARRQAARRQRGAVRARDGGPVHLCDRR